MRAKLLVMWRAWRKWAMIVAFLAIGLSWILSNPPGAAPDEPSHYVRMVGLAHGQLLGESIPLDTPYLGHTGEELERVNEEAGLFTIPGAAPPPVVCNAFQPGLPFACADTPPVSGDIIARSDHARYLPLPYVLPAVASLAGDSTRTTSLAGRAMFLVQDAALLVIAVIAARGVLREISPRVAALLVLSFTPLMAFQSATLAPNGTELFASIAYLLALLAAFRLRSLGWWRAAALLGVVTAWSRDLGIVWVVVFGVAAWFLFRGGARALWSARRRVDVVMAGVLAAGWIGALLWGQLLKFPLGLHVDGPSTTWTDVGGVIDRARESIGLVGWLDVQIDPAVQAAWIVAFLVFVVWAFLGATRIARIVVGVLLAGYVVGTLLLTTAMREVGFGSQARFTLPLLVAVSVVLAVSQGREARIGAGERWAFRAACAIAAAGHLSMLLINAHRQANGITGRAMDFSHVHWSPLGGWSLSLGLIVLASALVAVLPSPRAPAST